MRVARPRGHPVGVPVPVGAALSLDPTTMSAACCEELGPLLVGPGTSGRAWQCATCSRVWTAADVTPPATRKVLVVDVSSSSDPLVPVLLRDVARDGAVTVRVLNVERTGELILDARVADATIEELDVVDGARSRVEDAALVQRGIDILAMLGSDELADAVRRVARRARRA